MGISASGGTAQSSSSGLTVRGVQLAFQRAFGETPRHYLRDVRLERAHEELSAGSAGSLVVGDVAARCADQQGPEQAEEDEGLYEREDHAERVAHERTRLAREHGGGVAQEAGRPSGCHGAAGGVDAGFF